jgi:hypothetical protein
MAQQKIIVQTIIPIEKVVRVSDVAPAMAIRLAVFWTVTCVNIFTADHAVTRVVRRNVRMDEFLNDWHLVRQLSQKSCESNPENEADF